MMRQVFRIARKEIADHLSSKTFMFVLALFLLLTAAFTFQGIDSYQQQLEQYEERQGQQERTVTGPDGAEREITIAPLPKPKVLDIFGPLFSSAGFSGIGLIGALLGLLLSFNAISGEREQGTAELLLSYPVYKDNIINGKFLAGLVTMTLAATLSIATALAFIYYYIGAALAVGELIRVGLMLVGLAVYMSVFFGLGTLFSVVMRKSTTALTAGLVVMILVLTLLPQMSFMVADWWVEEDAFDEQDSTYWERQQEIRDTIMMISPAGNLQTFSTAMMGEDPNEDVTVSTSTGSASGGTSSDQQEDQMPSIRQSLSSASGAIGLLAGKTVALFVLSYLLFRRRELL